MELRSYTVLNVSFGAAAFLLLLAGSVAASTLLQPSCHMACTLVRPVPVSERFQDEE